MRRLPDSHQDHLPQSREAPAGLIPYVPPDNYRDDDETINLHDLWRIIHKYYRTILAFTIVVCALAIVSVRMETPVYQATATLEITPRFQGISDYTDTELRGYNPQSYQQTQLEIIRSPAVAEAVIERLNLRQHPAFNGQIQAQPGLLTSATQFAERSARSALSGIMSLFGSINSLFSADESEPVAAAPDDAAPSVAEADAASSRRWFDQELVPRPDGMVRRLQGGIRITRVGDSNLFAIGFQSIDRQLATSVVNAVMLEYLRYSGERRFESTVTAKAFLDREIRQVQARLESAERAINEFARGNQLIDLEDRSSMMTDRLRSLSNRLNEARNARISAESLYRSARNANVDSLPNALQNETISRLKQQYTTLRSEYAQLSGTFRPTYPRMQQLQDQINAVRSSLESELRSFADSIEVNFQQLSNEEELLQQALASLNEELLTLQEGIIQYDILKRERDINRQIYNNLLNRLNELDVAAGLQLDNASIIHQATVPGGPVSPNPRRTLMMALALGFAGGVGIAFLLAFLDNAVRDPEELERLLQMPTLGLLPHVNPKSLPDGGRMYMLSRDQPDKSLPEAMRSLRTSLMFSAPQGMPRLMLITSTAQGEGKSVVASNLATVLAQHGAKVLLVDADLRAPRLHRAFGVPRGPGLSDYLVNADLHLLDDKALGIENLSLLTAGTHAPNPAELLSSSVMDHFLESVAVRYDHVIIDSAPVMGLADAVVLSTKTDGVLLVASAGQVSKKAVQEASKRLRTVHAHLLGVVINHIDQTGSTYGYYSNYYYYYSENDRKQLRPAA